MASYGLYLRKGNVYLPTRAKAPGGGHHDIDPVLVVPVSDRPALQRAFNETFARGNPLLKTSVYADIPKPSTLKLAGVKSFSEFARGTLTWSILKNDGVFEIRYWKKGPVRGWVPDPDKTVAFPPGSKADDVIDRMIDIIREAAAVA